MWCERRQASVWGEGVEKHLCGREGVEEFIVCGRGRAWKSSSVFGVVGDAVDERSDRQLADTDAVNRHEHREPARPHPSLYQLALYTQGDSDVILFLIYASCFLPPSCR